MKLYQRLYFLKEDDKSVQEYLQYFLLYRIYSVPVIRECYRKWPELHSVFREDMPVEIAEIVDKSPFLSDKKIRKRLNKYEIEKAIRVLKSYQNCGVPLTNDPTIKQTRRKLTSALGDKRLQILQQAQSQCVYSDKMADLAIRCGHKFLFDERNYRAISVPARLAKDLTQRTDVGYLFPTIQLTKGCVNHCSHCCSRAEPHLSHMPWPIFATIYRAFQKHYKHYPQEEDDHSFSRFFSDSDMLTYHDPVMDVDSGDVCLWMKGEKGVCDVLTRGVRDDRTKIALKKVIISRQPVTISFVDTPKENMVYNQKQLQETLNIVEMFPGRLQLPNIRIFHLHLKSGPSVSDEIFRGLPVKKNVIFAMGRAKELPAEEIMHYSDECFFTFPTVTPNGDVVISQIKNGEEEREKVLSLYGVHAICRKKSPLKKLAEYFKRTRV